MADRSNAELYGVLFEALARHVDTIYGGDWEPEVDDDLTRLALLLLAHARNHDFSTHQMYSDDALARLGLAREIGDDNYEYVESPFSMPYPPDVVDSFQFFEPVEPRPAASGPPMNSVATIVNFKDFSPGEDSLAFMRHAIAELEN